MLLSVFALLSMPAFGAAGAAPAHIEENLSQARLAGKGTYTWFGLAIYEAELWVGDKGYRTDLPFALELRYARKLDGVKIAEASADQMEKIGAGSAVQRAQWLDKMKTIFPDVKEGTRISGVFVPGGGARFYLDGKALASVPDPEFARAFFGIWLDPATSARSLRAALLKHAGAR
ncbi:chalcone isomerase family protein [Massilia pseudoviolaceinigra]|uniref:chalcone isomerase family protein n=1 Tax=Massilia pseudoviolaceinigra TaxID=3057165 RepID=UPI0027963EBF|nr:chalcone isomerase family protein [Massilia sp. CCM 9206]MDQ1922850.1 chalcone isomerase family protein [Massilia sp. CCM 9206]